MNPIAPFITEHSDYPTAEAWLKKNVYDTDIPPVTLLINDEPHDTLTWEKHCGAKSEIVDYPEEAPFTRIVQPITYVCAEQGLRIELTVTTYPGYPVIEYDALLYNDADGNSQRLSNLQAIDTNVENNPDYHVIHGCHGSMNSYIEYCPITCIDLSWPTPGKAEYVSWTGRPTDIYLPCFNIENTLTETGTVALFNWQGTWKATFTLNRNGLRLCAGQQNTDFVLQKGESVRYPGIVLLFYRGDYLHGQNVYRRWLYQCNQFRYQGKHMEHGLTWLCNDYDTEQNDHELLQSYRDSGLLDLMDVYKIDAGEEGYQWYPTNGNGWDHVGSWTLNTKNYPNGLAPISQAARDAGMQFSLWFEPERVRKGTMIANELSGYVIGLAPDGSACFGEDLPEGKNCLLNYAEPEVVSYIVDLLDSRIREYGIDLYRQDFNEHPWPYWKAYDLYKAEKLGIPRIGITENHYCTGYLSVLSQIQKRNPGMYYDACASGGARYDLETMRYACMITRSDYWRSSESLQCQTLSGSMWFLCYGAPVYVFQATPYTIRSSISTFNGVGALDPAQKPLLREAIIESKKLSAYTLYDFYPLTGYPGKGKATVAIQYHNPEQEDGIFISYFRKDDELTLFPRGLTPDAKYRIWDWDDREHTEAVMTGRDIMQGIRLKSTKETAVVYEYRLVTQ